MDANMGAVGRVLILSAILLWGATMSLAQQAAPPVPYEVKDSPLPQGNNGIAARYRGARGLRRTRRWCFTTTSSRGTCRNGRPGGMRIVRALRRRCFTRGSGRCSGR